MRIAAPLGRAFIMSCISGSLLLLSACGGEKAEDTTTITATEPQADTAITTAVVDDFFSKIPSANAIPALLQRTGADYNAKLTNKAGSAAAYTVNSGKAALNLGVYGADIAYLCAYEKNKEAQAYLTDVQKLAEHLNANDAFGAAMLERMKKNVDNNDSLLALTDQGMKLASSLLKQSERSREAFLIGTGGFIEGLYLAVGLVESFPKDLKPADRDLILLPLTRSIADQKPVLADLVAISKSVNLEAEDAKLVKQLTGLLETYETLNLDEQIKNNKGDLILNDATLKSITTMVKDIRGTIVK